MTLQSNSYGGTEQQLWCYKSTVMVLQSNAYSARTLPGPVAHVLPPALVGDIVDQVGTCMVLQRTVMVLQSNDYGVTE
jgi:hypothetical protein